jgi:hypothetical protein
LLGKSASWEWMLERRSGRLGPGGTVGLMPQTFTQESPAQEEDFPLLNGGIAGVLYPLGGDGHRWEPFTALGVGGLKATGGLENTGFHVPVAGGIRARITERFSVEGGAEYNRLRSTQVDLGNNIQKDLKVTRPSLFLGARILW